MCQKPKRRPCNQKTTEQFQAEVFELVGDEYEVLTHYVNAKTPIQMKHHKCGNIYPVAPSNFKNGKRCPKCRAKETAQKNTKTHEQYCQEIREKAGDVFKFLSPYKGVKEDIEVYHIGCGESFKVNARQFLRFPTCHVCERHTRKKSHETFCDQVYEILGEAYSVIGTYEGTGKLVYMRHEVCGNDYLMYAHNVLKGGTCPKCRYKAIGEGNAKTKEAFLEELECLVGDEYSMVGEFKNATTKVQMRHNLCGHTYSVKPAKFKAGNRCPECYGTNKLTQEEFEQYVQEVESGEYEVVGSYVNYQTHIFIKHTVCDHTYPVKPSNFRKGTRCPFCRKSHGERRIERYFKERELPYLAQYKYSECRLERPLPFDLGLLNQERKVLGLIEYDGIQHFEPVERFGGEESFAQLQQRDQIKNEYCENHQIPLLRIPYWDYSRIEEILDEWLLRLESVREG